MLVKRRHRIFASTLKPFFKLYIKLRYKFSCDKPISMPEGSVILSNHTTTLDPVMISCLFKQHIYFMASKDIFNHRFIGKFLRFWVNPIPKEKGKKKSIKSYALTRNKRIKTCAFRIIVVSLHQKKKQKQIKPQDPEGHQDYEDFRTV